MNQRRCVARLFVALLTLTPAGAANALDFDTTFDRTDIGPAVAYAATYALNGIEHHVEIWSDGSRRVKKRTDTAIETYATRTSSDDVAWTMTVLDLRRRIRTDLSRTDLARLGLFNDWLAIERNLVRPRGPYDLETLPADAQSGLPAIAECKWYLLSQKQRVSRICWDRTDQLPLIILDGAGDRVSWRVTQLSRGYLPAGTFDFDDRGYVHNNLSRDMDSD